MFEKGLIKEAGGDPPAQQIAEPLSGDGASDETVELLFLPRRVKVRDLFENGSGAFELFHKNFEDKKQALSGVQTTTGCSR